MKPNVRFLTVCGLVAAVFCVLGPITVPIGPIPVSLMPLALYVAAYVLGHKTTLVSVAVYLLLGAAGMPVFSGYQGGLAKLVGPTGGYLLGYLFLALILGLAAEQSHRRALPCVIGMLLGTAVLYTFGTVWFMVETQTPLWGALTMCVLPFVPVDLCKMALALPVGRSTHSALDKAHLLPKQTG
jgi:biotin transport system substrate-specific component